MDYSHISPTHCIFTQHHSGKVVCCWHLSEVYTQRPESRDPFHTTPVDVKWVGVCAVLPEVYYGFVCF